MQKVITINLNGHAYQLEESGYEAIREYLATAARELEGNPDLTEIMADLEQAIAEKCLRFIGPHKSVVTAAEVAQIVAEMGPIDAAPGATGSTHNAAPGADSSRASSGPAAAKRLFRITDGAMIAGVCQGIATYFSLDVTLVRVVFAVTGIFSGVGIVAYLVMMFVVPEATTPEEKAAAGGLPFNAQEVVDRAKKQYAEGARQLRRHWRRHRPHWRSANVAASAPFMAGTSRAGVALLPVFSLIHLTLFLMMAAIVITLVNNGQIFGRELPEDVPMWAAVLAVVVVYQIFASPLRAAAQWSRVEPGWYAFWNAVVGLVGLAFVFWVASNHMPEIREFLQEVPHLMREFIDAVRDFVTS